MKTDEARPSTADKVAPSERRASGAVYDLRPSLDARGRELLRQVLSDRSVENAWDEV